MDKQSRDLLRKTIRVTEKFVNAIEGTARRLRPLTSEEEQMLVEVRKDIETVKKIYGERKRQSKESVNSETDNVACDFRRLAPTPTW